MSFVSQMEWRGRRFLCLAGLLAGLFGVAVPLAHAESSVYDNPRANVFLRYGVGAVYSGYTNIIQVVRGGIFRNTTSTKYGQLVVYAGKVHLIVPSGERIVATETYYQPAAGGVAVMRRWNGRTALKLRYPRSGLKLISVDVGLHSPKLHDQATSGSTTTSTFVSTTPSGGAGLSTSGTASNTVSGGVGL